MVFLELNKLIICIPTLSVKSAVSIDKINIALIMLIAVGDSEIFCRLFWLLKYIETFQNWVIIHYIQVSSTQIWVIIQYNQVSFYSKLNNYSLHSSVFLQFKIEQLFSIFTHLSIQIWVIIRYIQVSFYLKLSDYWQYSSVFHSELNNYWLHSRIFLFKIE